MSVCFGEKTLFQMHCILLRVLTTRQGKQKCDILRETEQVKTLHLQAVLSTFPQFWKDVAMKL